MPADANATTWRWERADDGVMTLWFDKPGQKLNILSRAAIDELDDRLAEIEGDATVTGVLIRSGKPSGFCAGADLHLLGEGTAAEVEAYVRRGLDVMDRLMRLGPATVAVLHGICLGGGLDLALACRHRVALASNVPFQIGSPEARLGLIPGWGAIEHLPRLIAPKDALDLLLYGQPIGYLHARTQCVASRLIAESEPERLRETLIAEAPAERPLAADDWREELDEARAKLAGRSNDFPEAQAAILRVIETDLAQGPEAAREATVANFVKLATSEDARHAISDFFHRLNR